ncbi:hypothetical protein ACXR2U_15840 [Jatrophihabitans sp. YIM 134969]
MLSRRRPSGDDGTTLAELVVCMCLTTIVGATALGFFVWTGDATRATTTNSFTQQDARGAMTTATGILRLTVPGSVVPGTVDAVTKVSPTVTFSASDAVVTGCPRRPAASISLTVASGQLRMTRTGPQNAPTASAPCAYRTNVATTAVLASDVQAGSGFSFTYRKVDGVVSTGNAQIGAVDVTLVVADRGGRTQTYTSTAVVSGGAA